jgi:hypothetical protein
VSPRGRVDRASAEAFAELGVHPQIVIPPPNPDTAGREQLVEKIGKDIAGRV